MSNFATVAEASLGRLINRFPSSVRIRNQAGTDDETVTCSQPIPHRSQFEEGHKAGDLEVLVLQSALTFTPAAGYFAVIDSETYRVVEVEKYGTVSYRLRLTGVT